MSTQREPLQYWMIQGTLAFSMLLFVLGAGTETARGDGGEHGNLAASYPMEFQPDAPYRFSGLESRAVTQENPTGGKGLGGKDRGNGNGRKGAPAFRNVAAGETKTLCDIEGPGMVRHLWITVEDRDPESLRSYIVRIYWDNSPHPSVEAPLGDLFGVAHGRTASFMTPYVGMPEGRSFHCYFPMPFSKRCRITFQNDTPKKMPWLFYQVDYTLGDKVTDDWGRFHAQFRRETTPAGKDYCLLDTHGSPGVFVGAVIGVNPKGPGWWGEGEIKFYIDGDDKYPTICGTGAEDYLCTGWGMKPHQAIYTGVNYKKDDLETKWSRFVSFYRFHVYDPIFFKEGLRVELQQIGAGQLTKENQRKYGWIGPHIHPNMSDWLYDRSDDYCSVVYWYQKLSDTPLPPLPNRAERIRDIAKQRWE
ncbi:MAG: DUF2961 domain-containing protein [Planctomycetaceae bacterium]|nr:DUF2961 domain-containing protein [Planctomycetaceae bacterium]